MFMGYDSRRPRRVFAGGRQQMSEDDEQLRVRVAWLYFMEGLTQADIAAKLGITRLRANRLLGEARASGLVSIQVKARLSDCVALERALVIGWGATLRETVRHLAAASLPDLSINSMMGGLTYGSELNTFEIASEFA